MKLKPEDLVVSSFQTSDAGAGAEAGGATPLCTLPPTPCTVCLICD